MSLDAKSDRERSKARGVTALAVTSAGGLLIALGLTLAAVKKWVGASEQDPRTKEAFAGFLDQLESVGVLGGFAALALVIGMIALVVLVRELSDDVERARRGPVEP